MKEKLYERGFFISSNSNDNVFSNTPFWIKHTAEKYTIYVHRNSHFFIKTAGTKTLFLIGHAYNPVRMQSDENDILSNMITASNQSEFYDYLNELTGIFMLGIINNGVLTVVGDAAGIQTVFYGMQDSDVYIASHTLMFEDVCSSVFDDYISRLVNYKFYHLFGKSLPGDLTPYKQFKRLIPNHTVTFSNAPQIHRFFPVEEYDEYTPEQADEAVNKIAQMIHKNMELITQKWKRPAISLTGGCDSKTTLACANGLYDKFLYFSYISNDEESVDAKAAEKICNALSLNHKTYCISSNDNDFDDLSDVREILRNNDGNIGTNNLNDVRKRAFFAEKDDFDIEVKSWVSECGRAYFNKRFSKKSFPKKPTPRYLSTLYKVFLTNRRLLKDTDRVFESYMNKYMEKGLQNYPWQELFFWEFRMSSWNGLVISGEHRYSFDITIPYNNRMIIDMLLRMPIDYRINDTAYTKIRKLMNPLIDQTQIFITNVKHTKNRARLERVYLDVTSRLPF